MVKRELTKRQKGFTLMELMVVVVIIGVLSAVAVPTIMKFIRRSREAEATLNLAALSRGASEYFNQEHIDNTTGLVRPSQYPNSRNAASTRDGFGTNPNTMPCQEVTGSPKYLRNAGRWHTANSAGEKLWVDLKFSIATSHYFQYGYRDNRNTGTAATYTIRARADLDCDSSLSTFQMVGRVNANTNEQIRGGIFAVNDGE